MSELIRHCVACGGRLWPWSRIGWIVYRDHTGYYHPRCLAEMREQSKRRWEERDRA